MTDPDLPTPTDAQTVTALATIAAAPHELAQGTVYGVTLPEGAEHKIVDLTALHESHALRPTRRSGTVTALDADSFGRLVTDLGAEHGRASIYADVTALTLTGVLNDNEAEGAGWADHRIVLPIVRTAQWARWLALNDKLGEQTVFAQHLEDNLGDIMDPPGADLLELAQSFEATTAAQFKSAARLKDGARQLVYVETIDARAGREGSIEVPEGFTLSLAPFEGADTVTVKARLRYRLNGGRLTIGYQLHQPQDIERAAFDSVVERVGGATEIAPYRARPPA